MTVLVNIVFIVALLAWLLFGAAVLFFSVLIGAECVRKLANAGQRVAAHRAHLEPHG